MSMSYVGHVYVYMWALGMCGVTRGRASMPYEVGAAPTVKNT